MQTDILKTIYSSSYIGTLISNYYNMKNIKTVFLLKSEINDIYRIDTEDTSYVLKIYTISKTISELEFEIDYMVYLKDKGILVPTPIKSINNVYLIKINYPEGNKFAILTDLIEGIDFLYNNKNSNDAYTYGVGTAKLHRASENFTPKSKKNMNIKLLLTKNSDIVITLLLQCKSDKMDFFKIFSTNLLNSIKLSYLKEGFCHGDLHGGNAKKNNDKVGFFDFEFCGYGYNIYDIATFKWGCMIGKRKNDWKNFINGYRKILKFNNLELNYLLHFVAIRHIFIMAMDIQRVNVLGTDIISNIYINNRFKLLEYIDKKIFNLKNTRKVK